MKRVFVGIAIVLLSLVVANAQTEQSPIVEKEIIYKDWTYKDIRSGKDVNLRDLTKGKKLTIVVYWAPWCGNWRHDAPKIERLYETYKDKGLAIIGVGEYDTVDAMKTMLDNYKITFPAVFESVNRSEREKTTHFGYRRATGDNRNWGSPYYVLLMPSTMEKKGDVLTKKTFVINGEMIEAEGEAFIRKQLKLQPLAAPKPAAVSQVDECDTSPKTAELKRP